MEKSGKAARAVKAATVATAVRVQACSDHDPFADCVGDLNGDCCVDKLDADILLGYSGQSPIYIPVE